MDQMQVTLKDIVCRCGKTFKGTPRTELCHECRRAKQKVRNQKNAAKDRTVACGYQGCQAMINPLQIGCKHHAPLIRKLRPELCLKTDKESDEAILAAATVSAQKVMQKCGITTNLIASTVVRNKVLAGVNNFRLVSREELDRRLEIEREEKTRNRRRRVDSAY